MYQETDEQTSCPLRYQSGAQSVKNFEAIVKTLEPEQRAAFESERAERQAEFDSYVANHGYHT